MPRRVGQDWEPSIPLDVADIYLRGVEQLLALDTDNRYTPSRERLVVEGRSRFLRELVDELKIKRDRPR